MGKKSNSHKIIFLTILLLFLCILALGCGKAEETKGEVITEEPVTEPVPDVTGNADNGKPIYLNNCMACHGQEGKHGHNGPDLVGSEIAEDFNRTIEQITNGKGAMPSFKSVLTEEQIRDLAAYVSGVLTK